jgi:hypothetical protein
VVDVGTGTSKGYGFVSFYNKMVSFRRFNLFSAFQQILRE